MPNTLTHLLSPHSFSPFSGSFVLGGKKKKNYNTLFLTFIKTGFCYFGGGGKMLVPFGV